LSTLNTELLPVLSDCWALTLSVVRRQAKPLPPADVLSSSIVHCPSSFRVHCERGGKAGLRWWGGRRGCNR